jgi:hypothetical protein
MIEERNQDDDWNRNAEKPEQDATTHTTLLNECAHQKTRKLFGSSLRLLDIVDAHKSAMIAGL